MIDPYDKTIRQFLMREFPRKLCGNSPELIDLLTEEILGTKSMRYGPKPDPETQVAIRDTLRRYVAQKRPIPFLVPWGSEKPDGSSVDIAELSALKVLHGLASRIGAHYSFGAEFVIRLEDASAPFTMFETAQLAEEQALRYVKAITCLNEYLGTNSAIRMLPESELVTVQGFNAAADKLLPEMEKALSLMRLGKLDEANVQLKSIGWTGVMNADMLGFYLTQYQKMFPNAGADKQWHRLARYFTAALARRHLKISGDLEKWNKDFLSLSFVPPIPGTEGVFAKRVYYRTMPMEYTSMHMPAWRAKGYVEINGEGDVTPKMTSWNSIPDLTEHTLTLTNERASVDVRTDYVLV